MIHFPLLRTRRLTVQLRELSIGESIAIAAMPASMHESSCAAFLRACVKSSKGIEDSAQWTVQERMLVVCHYLASVSDDGPDFSVSAGHYSDYLDGAADILNAASSVSVGEIGGDAWSVRHLTGFMAESIERITGEVAPHLTGRLHWLFGAMAAQMTRQNEVVPDAVDGEGAFDEFLIDRMRIMAGFPESDSNELMRLFYVGREKLHHLFRFEFSNDGLVALEKVGSGFNPARFPVSTCLSRMAIELVGKHG